MTIDLYLMPASGPCRGALMVAKELDIPVNLKNVDLMKGEHLTPEFLKMNPLHTVPVLDDNGFYLYESRAIMTYLVNKYAAGHDLYPVDPQTRATIDRFLYFDVSSIGTGAKDIYFPTLFAKTPVDPEKEKQFKEKLALLDSALEGKKYLVGNKKTLADLSIYATLSFLETMNYDLSEFKNVTSWINGLKAELPYNKEVNEVPIQQLKKALGTDK